MAKKQINSERQKLILELEGLNKRMAEIIRLLKKEDDVEEESPEVFLELKVREVLHSLAIPANLKGYYYLEQAITMGVKDSTLMSSVTKRLYPSLACKNETLSSRVERDIRHAIEVGWKKGNAEAFEKELGYSRKTRLGKPTNSEFLAKIADNIRKYFKSV